MSTKIYEIKSQSNEELQEKLNQLKREILELRLKRTTETLEKPHQFGIKRREIAKILTVLKERELGKNASTATS